MSPLLDSGSHGLRPVRNPLIRGALQQCGKKPLVEPDSHNRAGPSPDWGPPRGRSRQLPEVVTVLSLVYPGLDLLVAHTMSVEEVPTHGNIVYETQSRSLPRNRNTRHPDTTTEPDNDPSPGSPRTLLNCHQRSTFLTRTRRSTGRQTCSRRSRVVSGWSPLLAAGQASPSSRPSTARA